MTNFTNWPLVRFLAPFFAAKKVLLPRVPAKDNVEVLACFAETWKGKKTPRSLQDLERVVLHQTAVEFGVTQRQIRAAGSREAAYRARFAATPYHFVVPLRGPPLQIHPLTRYTYHAGPANRFSVGVAFEGLFPRFERERKDRHTTLDPLEQLGWRRSFGAVLRAIRRQAATVAGSGPNYTLLLVTHRQVTKRRLADPGEFIMRMIAAPAAEAAGFGFDYDWTMGTGRAAPAEWRAGAQDA